MYIKSIAQILRPSTRLTGVLRGGAQLEINLSRKWHGPALYNHQRSGVHLITENDDKLLLLLLLSLLSLVMLRAVGIPGPWIIYADGTWAYEGYRLLVAVSRLE